jgi:hypothetical protein
VREAHAARCDAERHTAAHPPARRPPPRDGAVHDAAHEPGRPPRRSGGGIYPEAPRSSSRSPPARSSAAPFTSRPIACRLPPAACRCRPRPRRRAGGASGEAHCWRRIDVNEEP